MFLMPKNQLGKKNSMENKASFLPPFLFSSKEIYVSVVFFFKALHNSDGKQNHSVKVSELEIPVRWGSHGGFSSVFLLAWKKRFSVVLYQRCCPDWIIKGRNSSRLPPFPCLQSAAVITSSFAILKVKVVSSCWGMF